MFKNRKKKKIIIASVLATTVLVVAFLLLSKNLLSADAKENNDKDNIQISDKQDNLSDESEEVASKPDDEEIIETKDETVGVGEDNEAVTKPGEEQIVDTGNSSKPEAKKPNPVPGTPKPNPSPVYTYKNYTTTEEIAFTVRIEYDATKDEGTSYVKVDGQNGLKTHTYKITYKDGIIESDVWQREVVTLNPVNKVIVEGTKTDGCLLSQTSSLEKQLMNEMNYSRCKNGVASLSWSEGLYAGAKIRSPEIVISFSHTRPDGSAFNTVAEGLAFGENIAYGYATASDTHSLFMNSPGHRANNLNEMYTTVAISVAHNSSGVAYWVVLFGW